MNPAIAETRQGTEAHSLRLQTAYTARARWTRTATARWLDDRAPAAIAALRRLLRSPVPDVRQPGYWLKEHNPPLFARAHERLATLPTDAAREQAIIPDIVR